MKLPGKILVIGFGAVSRCLFPLLRKHIPIDPRKITVMDFACAEAQVRDVRAGGARFVEERIERATLGRQLAQYVGPGDLIIDLAWNIGCEDIVQWCHDHQVLYVNTSVEAWDPYEGADSKPATERTLYSRHMALRRRMARWKDRPGTTAVLDHGANPGLVQHFTKQALEDIADKWLDDSRNKKERGRRYALIADARKRKAYNQLARHLGVKVIHISERDTQVANLPKQVDEFVNTWSIEGFFEEGTSPAEMGWGTHEKALPPRACVHSQGPLNQICIANMGVRTWVRSWVPEEEIVGMVVRHGEAFSISEHLTVEEGGVPVYRPTVHYAYHPCDAALVSLHELMMRNYQLQPNLRIMTDEITAGQDKLGCLLMGHDYTAWWIGSLLDIREARRLAPHQNATTLQVACSCLAAALWMLENPAAGVLLPDYLPHEFILKHARPYLGPWYSKPVDWTPLKNWDRRFSALGEPRPADDDVWQFNTFLLRGRQ